MTLKIQRSAKGAVVAFALSGRIKAEEVAELQRLFEVEGQDHRIVLDLKEVKLVDREAVRFLACCEANGAQLENCPPYIREWVMREGPAEAIAYEAETEALEPQFAMKRRRQRAR